MHLLITKISAKKGVSLMSVAVSNHNQARYLCLWLPFSKNIPPGSSNSGTIILSLQNSTHSLGSAICSSQGHLWERALLESKTQQVLKGTMRWKDRSQVRVYMVKHMQNMLKYAYICSFAYIYKYFVCKNMQKYAKICKNKFKYAKISTLVLINVL